MLGVKVFSFNKFSRYVNLINGDSFEFIIPAEELSNKIESINKTTEETNDLFDKVNQQALDIRKYRNGTNAIQSLVDYGHLFESSRLIKHLWFGKQSNWNYGDNPLKAIYYENVNKTDEMTVNGQPKNCWVCEAETELECSLIGYIKEGGQNENKLLLK